MKLVTVKELKEFFVKGDKIKTGGGRKTFTLKNINTDNIEIETDSGRTFRLSYDKINLIVNNYVDIDFKQIEWSVGEILDSRALWEKTTEIYLCGLAKEYLIRLNLKFQSNPKLFSGKYKISKQGFVEHYFWENNPNNIKKVKDNFRELNGHLFCEHCNFNRNNDQEFGEKIIQVHYRVIEEIATKDEDLSKFQLVCPNCHKIIHKKINKAVS